MKEDYEIHPLTSTQSEFAARHHDLVFRYLRTRHLPEEEFYSEVIWATWPLSRGMTSCPNSTKAIFRSSLSP